jgi:hypothetical protein
VTKIASGECSESSQCSGRPANFRTSSPRAGSEYVRESPPTGFHAGEKTTGYAERVIIEIDLQQPRAEREQSGSVFRHESHVGGIVEQPGPALFELREIASLQPSRQQFPRSPLETRFGRNLAVIELLKALTPPSEFDCPQRRLSGASNDIRHRILKAEQGVERGPQLGWPVKPDEVTIPNFSDR